MPEFKVGRIEFYKPPPSGMIRILDTRKPLPYSMHRVPPDDKPGWLYCPRDVHCPFCEALTAATRAYEFIEAQVGWTW